MAHKVYIISESGAPSELRKKFGTVEAAEENMQEASSLHHAVMDVVADVGAMTVNEMKVTEYKRYKKACYGGYQRFDAMRIRNMKKAKDRTRRRNPQILKAITNKVVHMVETIKGIAEEDWSNVGDVLYYAHFCRRPVNLYQRALRMNAQGSRNAAQAIGPHAGTSARLVNWNTAHIDTDLAQDPQEDRNKYDSLDEEAAQEEEAAEIAATAMNALQAAPVQALNDLSMQG